MGRLTSLLLILVALSFLSALSCADNSDTEQTTYTTYIPRGRSLHKRVSKYDYGQGVSFRATVVENTLYDDYASLASRSNNLHDSAKFRRDGNYRRRRDPDLFICPQNSYVNVLFIVIQDNEMDPLNNGPKEGTLSAKQSLEAFEPTKLKIQTVRVTSNYKYLEAEAADYVLGGVESGGTCLQSLRFDYCIYCLHEWGASFGRCKVCRSGPTPI